MTKLLLCLLALLVATPAMAQQKAPLYLDRNGNSQGATGTFCVATDATACPGGGVADPSYVILEPSGAAAAGITPVATTAVSSGVVAKASPGNVYRVSITTGGTAGYLMGFNATAIPADGAVTPSMCRVVAANATLSVSYADMPSYWTTGISFAFSSTGCFTKTASVTAFIEYSVK